MESNRDHFRILGIRGNSVRINTGIITFDVVVDTDRMWIDLPKELFINNPDNKRRLVGAILAEYKRSIGTVNEINQESNTQM